MKKGLFNVAVVGMIVLMAVCVAGAAEGPTQEDAKGACPEGRGILAGERQGKGGRRIQ